jgi:hypothetical protein
MAKRTAKSAKRWCPDRCPITGLKFFMWIEGQYTPDEVPTYGGPYDSYTIPERDEHGEFTRERFDHDEGGWVEGCDTLYVAVVDANTLHDYAELRKKLAETN